MQQPPQKKSVGPVIGIIIIVLVLIIGALYFWGSTIKPSQNPDTIIPSDQAGEQDFLSGLSASDEVENIASDLNATNLDGLDDTTSIETEVNAQ